VKNSTYPPRPAPLRAGLIFMGYRHRPAAWRGALYFTPAGLVAAAPKADGWRPEAQRPNARAIRSVRPGLEEDAPWSCHAAKLVVRLFASGKPVCRSALALNLDAESERIPRPLLSRKSRSWLRTALKFSEG
jgi:hypothetical protein